jgi:hypothetical protein
MQARMFAPSGDPAPVILPPILREDYLPTDVPGKTLEEQVAEREAQGEVVIDVVELGQSSEAPEEAEPPSALPLAAILGAAFLLL